MSGLKAISNKHCPYDLERYGGFAPYVGLLETPAPGIQAGRCFPGGHASGGFSLMAAFFIWRRRRPQRAYLVLAATFACGFVLGFGRILQGAHFLSHNLCTAWVCWLVAIGLYPVVARFAEHHGPVGSRNE
ncbi:MAG: phosphatase PAP2 family protein [Burkholderiales bacterium]|nr:phosphatase PAP2 family protein [Burkholderiales bacterium]